MDYFSVDLKQFLSHFLWRFAIAVAVIVFVAVKIKASQFAGYDSPNEDRVYGDQRVFDYADVLTDKEEADLEEYIHKAEKKICQDIVIVTLNESLKDFAPEYMANYDMYITPDKYVMVYADKFWEDNKFGYDQVQVLDGTSRTGDGVLLVDNLYREEETGKIYTWMCTTGKAENAYSSTMIDYALDRFYEDVESDYYQACKKWVDCVVDDLGPSEFHFFFFPVIVALIFLPIYIFANHKSKKGENTVTARTYLEAGSNRVVVSNDTFIRKDVTKVYDPPSSSSSGGGGGHHSSGGGGSHGGGGHSR